jgi:hypothetical protein
MDEDLVSEKIIDGKIREGGEIKLRVERAKLVLKY